MIMRLLQFYVDGFVGALTIIMMILIVMIVVPGVAISAVIMTAKYLLGVMTQ